MPIHIGNIDELYGEYTFEYILNIWWIYGEYMATWVIYYIYSPVLVTEQALVNVTEQIWKFIDKSEILLVHLDLSKTLNSLNHDLLLNKLVQQNIDSMWFESYLNTRTHFVIMDKIMSKSMSNSYRVPQWSILGPILFNISIKDIPKIILSPGITTSTTIYADDVQLLFSGTPNNLEQLKIYAETGLKTM